MNSKSVVTTTVGYMCLGLITWMLSMSNAAWFSHPETAYSRALLLPLAIILVVMGILAFQNERVLDSVVFFGGAALFWTLQTHQLSMVVHGFMHHHMAAHDAAPHGADAAAPVHRMMHNSSANGWFPLLWAVFFCYVWFGSFKAGLPRVLFLLGFWLTPLALAIGTWTGSHFFMVLGGYLGLASAILALIVSACAIISHGCASSAPAAPKAG